MTVLCNIKTVTASGHALTFAITKMEVFFTSYSHGKLGRQLNELYMPINRRLSELLDDKDYGSGLTSWFLMFIMVPADVPGANDSERVLYKKKDKTGDLRLHLSNEDFRAADETGRRALVVACIMRSLDLLAKKKIPDFNIAALTADVQAIAEAEGWVAAA